MKGFDRGCKHDKQWEEAEHSQHHGLPEISDYAQTERMGLTVLGFRGKGSVGLFKKKKYIVLLPEHVFHTVAGKTVHSDM